MKNKTFAFVMFLILSINCTAQKENVDSLNVAFKAKLLTISPLGVADSLSVLKNVLSQKVHFIPNTSVNILLIKIEFNQEYFLGNKNEALEFFGNCCYYIAYNKKFHRFYRLGGFDFLDIDEFFEDIEKSSPDDKMGFLYGGVGIFGEFDLQCMLEYYEMSPKKRLKMGYECFDKCSKEIFSTITVE